MQTPLNASASTAGALLSTSIFDIPPFQREYSWMEDEVADFWNDLSAKLETQTYFLGLVILTDETPQKAESTARDGVGESSEFRKHVVDGQQRIVTLTLLATALYFEAQARGRSALADRIQADFLRSIDYGSDETKPRVRLSDEKDDATFQSILSGESDNLMAEPDSVSGKMLESYNYIRDKLRQDLKSDPFKRLGKWTEFITHKLYFAVFIHPDASSAYEVYEVINTRGKNSQRQTC